MRKSIIERREHFRRASTRAVLALTVSLFLCGLPANSQRLPIISYQIGDGLPHNNIKRVFQDAKGYLWIATWEGLSRFDGYEFTNYGTDDGLGHAFINDVTADNNGNLWIATNGGGISRLVDQPPENSSAERKKFVSFPIGEGGEANGANFVNRILFDADNRLWCVTDGGLYRASSSVVAAQAFELVMRGGQPIHGNAALRDSRGRLWFGVSSETDRVLEISGNKTTAHEVREGAEAPREIHTIIEDSTGRILAADLVNVFEFIEPTKSALDGTWRKLPATTSSELLTIAAAPDGGLWIGTDGLIRLNAGQQTRYGSANGLTADNVQTLFFDRDGNLWIGTAAGGLNKLSGRGVVSYSVEQGLRATDVRRIIEDQSGRLYAQNGCGLIALLDDRTFSPLPGGDAIQHETCAASQIALPDSRGNWWFSTERGLEFLKGPDLDPARGRPVIGSDGQPVKYRQIYEDAEANIWLTNERTGELSKVDLDDNALPRSALVANDVPAEYIVRDRNSGTIWLANRARLWRVRNGNVSSSFCRSRTRVISAQGIELVREARRIE